MSEFSVKCYVSRPNRYSIRWTVCMGKSIPFFACSQFLRGWLLLLPPPPPPPPPPPSFPPPPPLVLAPPPFATIAMQIVSLRKCENMNTFVCKWLYADYREYIWGRCLRYAVWTNRRKWVAVFVHSCQIFAVVFPQIPLNGKYTIACPGRFQYHCLLWM